MAYFWNILCPSGSEHGERKYREANKKNISGFIFYKGNESNTILTMSKGLCYIRGLNGNQGATGK